MGVSWPFPLAPLDTSLHFYKRRKGFPRGYKVLTDYNKLVAGKTEGKRVKRETKSKDHKRGHLVISIFLFIFWMSSANYTFSCVTF